MFGSALAVEKFAQADWQGYAGRAERGVSVLAEACGQDALAALAQFRRVRGLLGRAPQPDRTCHDPVTQMAAEVMANLPQIIELVATLSEGRLKGYAFLSQGRPGAPLPVTMGTLLAAAFELLVAEGRRDDAALLAEVFALAFPRLGALGALSPLAQGLIIGVAPKGAQLAMKSYFNTRLDATSGHGERIQAILQRLGLTDHGLYHVVYGPNSPARFHGLGVDLDGDDHRRAKLYVRLEQPELTPLLGALLSGLTHTGSAATHDLLLPIHAFEAALQHPSRIQEVELAVALSSHAPPTLKVTYFFAGQTDPNVTLALLTQALGQIGYIPPLAKLWQALTGPRDRTLSQAHPLHGVGIELPTGAPPKVNLYLQPTL